MNKDVSELEAEARMLAPRDRARLVRRLIASLDAGQDSESEQVWLDEAEKRLAAYRRGEVTAVPGNEVFDELLKHA